MLNALAGLLLLASPSVAPATGTVNQVVARVVAAYGGQKALDGAHAIRETGHVTSPTRGTATLLREFEGHDRLRIQVEFSTEDREVRLLDGARASRNGKDVAGPPRDAMVLQAARLELPALLSDAKTHPLDLGEVKRDGAVLRALEISLGAGMKLTVLVAPDGRIVRTESTAPAGAMGTLRFDADYSDFRVVKGVLYAFTEDTHANGQATGQTRLDNVEVLTGFPVQTWKP